ncbi:Ig-like domain-containing protein [Maribellus sediminis]|uniref:Ig-like domain-containing protein n=1 Tax=Maribellus sediminis TaxID=2696285 RepID=UPI0014318C0D|nr:Ig-like domain-containing protein [Maribellus sediminis]
MNRRQHTTTILQRNLNRILLFILLVSGLTAAHETTAQMNLRVRGNGIDIDNVGSSGYKQMYSPGTKIDWEDNFWIPGQYHLFNGTRPAAIVNKDFATTAGGDPSDKRKDYSIDSFSADAAGVVTIAVPSDTLSTSGWTKTSTSFSSTVSTFTLYTYNYTTPGTWIDIPGVSTARTVLFADRGHVVFDNPIPLSSLAEGVLIDKSTNEYYRGDYTYDPDLYITSNGDYIAGEKNRRYISTDKGQTWDLLSSSYNIEHASTFEHNGALYIIGDEVGNSAGRGAINKSTDGGKTWGEPTILLDDFRNSPSHVEVTQGRIWIAFENLPNPHIVNFLSASVNSDLMQASSWIKTTRTDNVGTGNETDMVLGRDGWPIAMPKSGGPPVKATSATSATARASDKFTLPGSNSKYTAKYDSISDKYYALTSNSEIYPYEDRRLGITLWSSVDLKTWTKVKVAFQGKSQHCHGFNYPSMQIDGDDIIFVLRTAWEYEKGQAQRWHDANSLTFHRIRNFRDIKSPEAHFEKPAEDTRIPTGGNLEVLVNAVDSNATIVKVDLYLNEVLVRSDSASPYQWGIAGQNDTLLENMSAGYYTLKAIAYSTDNENVTITRNFQVGDGASAISISVQGEGFTKRIFDNGAEIFTNRTYTILNAPQDFIGFEFLASDGKVANSGTITAEEDGFIYIIAPASGISGWDLVPNSQCNYSDGGQTSLAIYQKAVVEDETVDIPNITAFPGASPLAKSITLNTPTSLSNDIALNDQFSVLVYPNPATGLFNIEFVGAEMAEVMIYNLNGSEVFSKKNLKSKLVISNQEWMIPGFYFIRTFNGVSSHISKLLIN